MCDKRKKVLLLSFFITAVIIAGAIIKKNNYFLKEYPYIVGESNDKKWVVYGRPSYEGGKWAGEAFYRGNKKGDAGKIYYSVEYNGKKNYCSEKVNPSKYYKGEESSTDKWIIKENVSNVYALWEFAEEDIPKVKVMIQYKEGNQEKKEIINLKYKVGTPKLKDWIFYEGDD